MKADQLHSRLIDAVNRETCRNLLQPFEVSNYHLFVISSAKNRNLQGPCGNTPSGSVSFVSQLYYGSLSNREIVERSGLLHPNIYNEGDEIMADKGFNIRDLTYTFSQLF